LGGDQIFQEGIGLYKELYVAHKLNYVVERFRVKRSLSANATANITVPHHHTEAAALPQNTIIGIAVGVSAGLVAFVWAVARYIYNKRYLDTVHAKTLNLRVVNT
jgi:hypothetical protein